MSTFFFLFRELLGAVRARSALFFSLNGLFILLCLVSFALLLLPASLPEEGEVGIPAGEVVVRLSPRLAAATVDSLYLQIQESDKTRACTRLYAQQIILDSEKSRQSSNCSAPLMVH